MTVCSPRSSLIRVGIVCLHDKGDQWLSGRVLDSRPKGCGLEPHWLHCIVCLNKTHKFLLSTGSTLSQHNLKIVDWDVKNQIKELS